MSATIWLVRHGSTAWTGRRWCGSSDVPLSADGRAEAVRLARLLAARLPTRVDLVSSPARRATETAATIGRAIGAVYRMDERLREVDFGEAEGSTWRQLERRQPVVAERIISGHLYVDWPGGDSADDIRARVEAVRSGLETMRGHAVYVTHGGLIRGLMSRLADDPRAIATVPPASATMVRHDGTRWSTPTPKLAA